MRILTKKSLGFGDVKLIAVVGAYLGPENVLAAAFIAAFAAAGFGIIQKIRKKGDLHTEISFGPFIAAGVSLVLMLGM